MTNGVIEATVLYPVDPQRIWLARKKMKIGAGLYNGWGGKFAPELDPDIRCTAVREFRDESGYRLLSLNSQRVVDNALRDMKFAALFDFYEAGRHRFRVHYFFAPLESWDGLIRETDEMGRPEYFNTRKLPFKEMMAADRVFLPRILKGDVLCGSFHYNEGNRRLTRRPELRPFEAGSLTMAA